MVESLEDPMVESLENLASCHQFLTLPVYLTFLEFQNPFDIQKTYFCYKTKQNTMETAMTNFLVT